MNFKTSEINREADKDQTQCSDKNSDRVVIMTIYDVIFDFMGFTGFVPPIESLLEDSAIHI